VQQPGAVLLVALATLLVAASTAVAAGPQPRIINGDPATADGQFPWTVALVEPSASADKRAFCGGTLIAPKIVLTAAHCTIGSRPTEIDVVVGDHDLSSVAPGNVFDVTRISLHPGAEGDDDDIVPRRDVSLLQLDQDEALGTAAPVTLASNDEAAAAPDFEVTGWGLTEDSVDTVDVMQFAEVDRVDDLDCGDIFESLFGALVFSPADQICAIRDPSPSIPPEDDVIDTCNGDSGGPLVWDSTGSASVTASTDWRLVGVTSWGLDCAAVLDDGTVVPGVYARAAGTQLRDYVLAAVGPNADPAGEQPTWDPTGDDPQIAVDGDAIFCVGNPLDWTGTQPDQMEQLIRRRLGPGSYETVSFTGLYFLDEGDFSDDFVCEVHGRAAGVGGYGLARSAVVNVDDAPAVPPTIVTQQVPIPVPTPVLVPGPATVVPVPQPRVEDDTDPRITSVRRSCTRRRICTFTVQTSDTGTGVKTLAAALNTVRARSCRRGGRRTTCASWRTTALGARAVPGRPGTFRITTRRLARGTHVLHVQAVDGAGNIQTTPRRLSFRLR
jgi:secreted trypsin-like serine protease